MADTNPLNQLVSNLSGAHGDNLASITLYGATAAEESDPLSSHNVLVVLRKISVEDLRLSVQPLRAWTKAGQPMPVYFSVHELQRGADVFPIEFLQMQNARKVLYGSDPFEFAHISQANLRHQTEYELRAKFLQLRRLYFPAANSPGKLIILMTDSLSSFVALFRATLMLMGQEAPTAKRQVIRATAELLHIDEAPFERILGLNVKREKLTDSEANEIFAAYVAEIEKVIDAVDRDSSSA